MCRRDDEENNILKYNQNTKKRIEQSEEDREEDQYTQYYIDQFIQLLHHIIII